MNRTNKASDLAFPEKHTQKITSVDSCYYIFYMLWHNIWIGITIYYDLVAGQCDTINNKTAAECLQMSHPLWFIL